VPSSDPHDEFLELCAVSTSGQLTREEQARLDEHLASCPPCREALREYQAVADQAMPAIGALESASVDPGPAWSQSKAEKELFRRLREEDKRRLLPERQIETANSFRRILPVAPETTWRHVWMLYAAGILLFVTLGLCAYWVGMRRGTDLARSAPPADLPKAQGSSDALASLEAQLSDAAHERQIARAEAAEKGRALVALRQQLEQETREIKRLRDAQTQLESNMRGGEEQRDALTQQQKELAQKLDKAQIESQMLRAKMDSMTSDSAQQGTHAIALEAKIKELTRLLEDREKSIEQQEQLLAHDRDIRELMGARDLYIADVFDVDDNGATKKPYGRVFYTKGKSLIFYAYDLDQLGGRRAQAFQAWGRRGPDFKQALNLGIFYEDNASKKRWVVKLDDPKTLAEIEGVFVTIEPHGGSEKPSGRPLLSAYLRLNANHP